MDPQDAKYVATLKKIQTLLLRSEAEMEKSFQHSSNRSNQWLERLVQSQNVLTLCSNELCSWLSYWGLESLEKTFKVLYHLHRTHLDYVLEGYMQALRRCENKGIMITASDPPVEDDKNHNFQNDVVIRKKTKENLNTVNVYEFKALEKAREIEEAIQKFEEERIQREAAMKLEEEQARIDRVLNGSDTCLEDVGLSPIGIIDENLGIVKRLVETHDKSTKQLENFLNNRKSLANDNIENLGTHLQDILDECASSDSGDSDADQEREKNFQALEGKESLNNALNNIESSQKEIVKRSILYYKRLKNGVTFDKGCGPDLKIFDLEDVMFEKERLARTVVELEKELREKGSAVQTLKLSIQGKADALDGNIGRIKTLEAKVAEYRSQLDLFKRELAEKNNTLYSQTEKLLKSQDQDKTMKEIKEQLKAAEEKLVTANKTISVLKEEAVYGKKGDGRSLRGESRNTKTDNALDDKKRKGPALLARVSSLRKLTEIRNEMSENRDNNNKNSIVLINEDDGDKSSTRILEDGQQVRTIRNKPEPSSASQIRSSQSPKTKSSQQIHSLSANNNRTGKKIAQSSQLPTVPHEARVNQTESTTSPDGHPDSHQMKSVNLLKPDSNAFVTAAGSPAQNSPVDPSYRFQFKGAHALDKKRADLQMQNLPKQTSLTEALTEIIREQIRVEILAQDNSREKLSQNSQNEPTLLEEIHRRRRILPVRTMSMADFQANNDNPKDAKETPSVPKMMAKQLKARRGETKKQNQSYTKRDHTELDFSAPPIKFHNAEGAQVLDLTALVLERSKSQVTLEKNAYTVYKKLPTLRSQLSETSRSVQKAEAIHTGRSVSVMRGSNVTVGQNMSTYNQILSSETYSNQNITANSDNQPNQQSPKISAFKPRAVQEESFPIVGVNINKKKAMALPVHQGFDAGEFDGSRSVKTEEDEMIGDRELEILYAFLRKDGAHAPEKMSMMRRILGGEKSDTERNSLDKRELDVEDMMALKSLFNFKAQVRLWLNRHDVCGRECKHLKEFFKNIGYIRHILEHTMSRSTRRRKMIQMPVTVIGVANIPTEK